MNEILFHYERVPPATWAYLSSLLTIGLFFKFNRVFSVRNLDLLLLIALAPGLLLIHHGQLTVAAHEAKTGEPGAEEANPEAPAADETTPRSPARDPASGDDDSVASVDSETSTGELTAKAAESVAAPSVDALAQGQLWESLGFLWVLSVTGLLLLRTLVDPVMVRRPLLEPNLSLGGLNFIGCFLFVFLMANVLTGETAESDLVGPRMANQMMTGQTDGAAPNLAHHGPGHVALNFLPSILTVNLRGDEDDDSATTAYTIAAKVTAILAHLAIVIGIVGVGYWHFGAIRMGIGAATLYLMLPYTAISTGRITHVLPAACLTWAVLSYRRPLASGICLGLATGTMYYPVFLLPLWASFYWQRGLARFAIGVGGVLALLVMLLPWIPPDSVSFWDKLASMFSLRVPAVQGLEGVWKSTWDPSYRWPVLAAFVCLSLAFAFWPPQKNLGTLLGCSASIMLAVQFCHGFGGGEYVAWYLPLLLLTVFRPNLEDRVALTVLSDMARGRRAATAVERAA